MTGMFGQRQPLLPEVIDLHGKWRPGKAAILCGDRVTTWRDFAARVRGIANGLAARGLPRGARIGILMDNEVATIETIFGVMRAGMVAVPINLSVADHAAAMMLADAGVSALFVTADQVARADALAKGLPNAAELFLCVAGPAPAGWTAFEAWLSAQPQSGAPFDGDGDLLANIIYSSGTTGVPKGISHSQGGRLDWAYDLAVALRYHGGARTLLTLGLYSNISWVMMLCTVLAGGTLVLEPRFDAGAVLRTIATRGVTHMAMVPVQYRRLLDHPEFAATDLSRLQSLMSCGSALPAPLKADLIARIGCGVIELYGLTEGVITTLDPEEAEDRLASVGRPIQGTDIRLIDDNDRDVTGTGAGEIVGQCRFAMTGYWKRAKETAEATWFDESGRPWLRTGDIGRLDEDGFLYIVDRKKDMILSGGQNIYPADIEQILSAYPEVRECAVIGVPHPEWGESPLAVVVPATDEPVPADVVMSWLNAQLGKRQRVGAVVYRDALPRNPNGKVLKRELRALYATAAG